MQRVAQTTGSPFLFSPLIFLVFLTPGAGASGGQSSASSSGPSELHIARAELALHDHEPAIAESEYRAAIAEALSSLAVLDAEHKDFSSATTHLEEAATVVTNNNDISLQLGIVHLQRGDIDKCVEIAREVLARDPSSADARQIVAEAYSAKGRTDEAITELTEAHRLTPEDPRITYALAVASLKMHRLSEAEKFLAQFRAQRPGAATRVLIGRTYRDFEYYPQAEDELRQALILDPSVRRAHYYLAVTWLLSAGESRQSDAANEFRQELKLSPGDYLSNLYLGTVLVGLQRHDEAIPSLLRATFVQPNNPDPLFYLGEAYLFSHKPQAAYEALSKSVRLTSDPAHNNYQLANAEYLLGQALRKVNRVKEAENHIVRSKELKQQATASSQQSMSLYLNDEAKPPVSLDSLKKQFATPIVNSSGKPPNNSEQLRKNMIKVLARSYFNLGIMEARSEHYVYATSLLKQAALWQQDYPGLQYSLGLANFNAGRYTDAAGALETALRQDRNDLRARHLLGMAYFRSEAYDRAAVLLARDPERDTDPNVLYALAVSLVRSGKSSEGEQAFAALMRQYPESPDVYRLLGEASAQQKDYKNAIVFFQRALQLNHTLPEVHSSLGVIYLRTGQLQEAEGEFRRELEIRPEDPQARYNLAFTLDLEQRPKEALALLEQVLQAKPDYAEAHATLGKIRLAKGDFEGALEQLESAAQLSPNDANVHYQLGQAYQKLGRTEDAEEEFSRFRDLRHKGSAQ